MELLIYLILIGQFFSIIYLMIKLKRACHHFDEIEKICKRVLERESRLLDERDMKMKHCYSVGCKFLNHKD